MTLVVGLKGAEGVVLASDSQATHGTLKRTAPKLFKTTSGIVWGTAGPLAASQVLYTLLKKSSLGPQPGREETRVALREAVIATANDLGNQDKSKALFEGLFAWFDSSGGRHYLLRIRSSSECEFMTEYGAIGSSQSIGDFGFFAFSRSEFLDFKTLPIDATKMLTFTVADDAVRASAQGVGAPIQLAVVSKNNSYLVKKEDLQAVQDTASAFKMHQGDFLKRPDDTGGVAARPGLSPPS